MSVRAAGTLSMRMFMKLQDAEKVLKSDGVLTTGLIAVSFGLISTVKRTLGFGVAQKLGIMYILVIYPYCIHLILFQLLP